MSSDKESFRFSEITDGKSLCYNLDGVLAVLRHAELVSDEVTADDIRLNTGQVRDNIFNLLQSPEVKHRIHQLTGVYLKQIDDAILIGQKSAEKATDRQLTISKLLKDKNYEAIDELVQRSEGFARQVLVSEIMHFILDGEQDAKEQVKKMKWMRSECQIKRLSNETYATCLDHVFGEDRRRIIDHIASNTDGSLQSQLHMLWYAFQALGLTLTRSVAVHFAGENCSKLIDTLNALPNTSSKMEELRKISLYLSDYFSESAIKSVAQNLISHCEKEVNEAQTIPEKLKKIQELCGDRQCDPEKIILQSLLRKTIGNQGELLVGYFYKLYEEGNDIAAVKSCYEELPKFELVKTALNTFLKRVIGDNGKPLRNAIDTYPDVSSKIGAVLNFSDLTRPMYSRSNPKKYMTHPDRLMTELIGEDLSGLDAVLERIEDPYKRLEKLEEIRKRLVDPCLRKRYGDPKNAYDLIQDKSNQIIEEICGNKCEHVLTAFNSEAGLIEKFGVFKRFEIAKYHKHAETIRGIVISHFDDNLQNIADVVMGKIVQGQGFKKFEESRWEAYKALNTVCSSLEWTSAIKQWNVGSHKERQYKGFLKKLREDIETAEYQLPDSVEL